MWTTGGPDYTSTPFGLYPEGVHGFRVWAQDEAYHQAWSAEQTVVADRTPPTVALTLHEHSPYAHTDDTTVYYAEHSGSFTVTAALEDSLAGLADVTFPDATAPGITHALSGLTTGTRLRTYTFSAISTFNSTISVTATDRATNVGAAPFTVTLRLCSGQARDTAPPTLTLSPAVESGALRVTWSATDTASGVDAGACTLELREDAGDWQPFSTACAGDEVHTAAQPGHVYTFRLSASDNVGNPASATALARFPRVTKYYYHGSTRVAMRADGVVYYLHADHLGSTSLVTDGEGNVHSRQLFLPYGDTRWQEGALPTDFGFGGQRHDGSTGLVFMHARYYHAGLGRFVSADTIVPNFTNPQLFNRYSYASNNPILYNDPDGHCGPLCILGLVAVGAMVAMLPGDTPTPGSPGPNQVIGEAAMSSVCEPCDYAFTIARCSQGECNWFDYTMMAMPLVPATVGRAGRLAGRLEDAGDVARAADRLDDASDLAGAALRNVPGTVTGGHGLSEVMGQWLRGSHGNAGRIPGQVADQLRGRTFNNFDEFREVLWKAVADDPSLASQFTTANQKLMAAGQAPIAPMTQQTGRGWAQMKYNLHHLRSVAEGGGLYDLDNIVIVTPRYHNQFTYGH